jgi:hypothetical protein
MKLHMLPIGAHSESRGGVYVKSARLTGVGAGGGQRLFPRASAIQSLDSATQLDPTSPAAALTPQAVREALDELTGQWRRQLSELEPSLGEAEVERPTRELGLARQAFAARIGLDPQGG